MSFMIHNVLFPIFLVENVSKESIITASRLKEAIKCPQMYVFEMFSTLPTSILLNMKHVKRWIFSPKQ